MGPSRKESGRLFLMLKKEWGPRKPVILGPKSTSPREHQGKRGRTAKFVGAGFLEDAASVRTGSRGSGQSTRLGNFYCHLDLFREERTTYLSYARTTSDRAWEKKAV